MTESIFIENFKSVDDIIREYEAPADALEGAEVLLAWYGYGSYEGDSLVIFRKEGKLFEVNASHCSCYGLEGRWEPEETTPEALLKRTIYDGCDGSKEAEVRLHDLARSLAPTTSGSAR